MAQSAGQATIEPALERFARKLSTEIDACRVLMFDSRARDQAQQGSDYDLIIVSGQFAGVDPLLRGIGLRSLWYEAGGVGPMDLICLTPEEFAEGQQRSSLVAAVLPDAIDLLSSH
ncbi:nucleotidyltransferase domain-containing protein [soil metagenome]